MIAKVHKKEDSSTMAVTQRPDLESAARLSRVSGKDLWCIFLLGMNFWFIVSAWPLLFMASITGWDILLVLLTLGPLGIGIALFRRFPLIASWFLLLGYPVCLAGVMALRPASLNRVAHTPPALLFAVLSSIAYCALVNHISARTR